jgi:anti-anti-sigma factor
MHVAVTTSGTALWIRVSGEVDLSNHHRLRTALAIVDFSEADLVNLDVRQLDFCDTRGCGILLSFEREARLSGHQTTICGASPSLRQVLDCIAPEDALTFS